MLLRYGHRRQGTCLRPRGMDGCPPLSVCDTPRVPEHEAAKIRRALERCEHSGKDTT